MTSFPSSFTLERELQQEMDKLAKQYGGGEGVDMTKFPEFKFADPKIARWHVAIECDSSLPGFWENFHVFSAKQSWWNMHEYS